MDAKTDRKARVAEPIYVDNADALAQLCERLAPSPWLALDTEFLRERTYYPKFCLLQVATPEFSACVDPLSLPSLEPLLNLIVDPARVKVFHAARQDLEIFFQLKGQVPAPVFDTQIAAPLLGLAEQISYAGLIREILGVELSKAHSRTDWSRRPLSPEQLRYAADDVIYLAQAYLQMVVRLQELGRQAWLEDDFTELTSTSLYEVRPHDAWQRIGGSQHLNDRALAVLQALAAWREVEASTADLPRGWIVKDEVLIDLSRQQPKNPADLAVMRGIDERAQKRWGPAICRIIADAREQKPVRPEWKSRAPKRTPGEEAAIDALLAVVRLRAADNTLNPAVLAGRRDVEALLDGDGDAALLHGWRKKMIGEELLALLDGRLKLAMSGGLLRVDHAG